MTEHNDHIVQMASDATLAWYETDQDRGGMAAIVAYYEGYLAALKERIATPARPEEE